MIRSFPTFPVVRDLRVSQQHCSKNGRVLFRDRMFSSIPYFSVI
jgi:hypothetical protein